jgi:glycosyltransferase involved in cell wall biosynthesis
MRIAIDASPLLDPHPTGVGRVVREVLRELSRRDLPHEIFAVAPGAPPPLDLPDAARTRIEAVAIAARGRRWRHGPADAFIRSREISVFFSTVSAFPLRADCATVATVHEVPWEAAGTRGDEGTGWSHRLWATLDAWYASRIVCPSRATAEAFLRSNLRRGSRDKVAVVPWGVNERFVPKAPEGEVNHVDDFRIRPDYPFFLIVAAPRKKKNFDLAMRALRVLRDRSKIDGRIVIAGPNGEELRRAMGYADGLGLRQYSSAIGYVPERDLPELYRRARATLVLSHSEGFAFPALESMACGTPVLHTGAGSLPELVGDAGLAVPADEEAVAEGMAKLHLDEAIRADLSAKGIARAAGYRWSRSADRLLSIFAEIGGEPPVDEPLLVPVAVGAP